MKRRVLLRAAFVLIAVALQLAIVTAAMAAPLSARPHIALTFDDAPLASTPLLLILQEKQARSTWFVVGQYAEWNPEQAQAIAASGALIGNHSYDHADFTLSTAEEIRANLSLAQTTIQTYFGVTPHWYRSPYLAWNDAYDTVLPELGLQSSWPTIDPQDWAGTAPAEIASRVRAEAAPGGVVLLHDQWGVTNTIEALPGLIDGLRADGYELVTLDDLGLGALSGTATEGSGAAVAGATVTLFDAGGAEVASTQTRADGSYSFDGLAAGLYRVGFEADGFAPCFYDGATDLAGAESIMVSADHTIAGADATLGGSDTTPPETSLAPALPSGWVNHDVSFELAATDAGSPDGIVTRYRLTPPGTASVYSAPVTITGEGETAIAYWSQDSAGNTEAEKTGTVRIDKTAPVTTSDAKSSYSGPATIKFTAADTGGSGVAATRYVLDGGAEQSGGQLTVTALGTHTLSFRSTDAAGNAEQAHTVTFAIAEPAGGGSTSISLSTKSATVGYAATTHIKGTLKAPQGDPSGKTVILQTSSNNRTWADLAITAVTGAGGAFDLTCNPTAKTYYRVRFAATGGYTASTSGSIYFLPAARLSAPAAPATVSRGKSFAIEGTLEPRHTAGSSCVLIYAYRYQSGSWVALRIFTAKASDYSTYSKYKATASLPYTGTWKLGALHSDSDHATTWSSQTTVTVK